MTPGAGMLDQSSKREATRERKRRYRDRQNAHLACYRITAH
jgi:hypothetical protein